MNTNEITDEQVASWLKSKIEKMREVEPKSYIKFWVECADWPQQSFDFEIQFSAYCGRVGHQNAKSSEESLTMFREAYGQYTPAAEAKKKREQAAALLAEAAKLDPQPC